MTRDRCCFCGGKVEGYCFYICTQCGAALGVIDLIKKNKKTLQKKYKQNKHGVWEVIA